MIDRIQRRIWITTLAAGLLVPAGACTNASTASAIADLAASTSGSLVEILVSDYLQRRLAAGDKPDLGAPIADQEH